jgi:ribosomal protein L7/L12
MIDPLALAFVACVAVCAVVLFFTLGQISFKTARLQRQMDALVKHFGIDLTETAVKEAQALMKSGRKIEAIKVYREYTGVGLAEAKAAVEKMA